jgi:hypothetical protein
MAEVHVRKLEPWVVEMLRDQARHAGYKNLESYLRERLREEALRKRREFAARLEARQAEFRQKHGLVSDSAELIRQDREERG